MAAQYYIVVEPDPVYILGHPRYRYHIRHKRKIIKRGSGWGWTGAYNAGALTVQRIQRKQIEG